MRGLLVTQGIPWPFSRHGAAQRTELVRRALATRGPVDTVCVPVPAGWPIDADRAALAAQRIIAWLGESGEPSAGTWSRVAGSAPGPLGRLAAVFGRQDAFYAEHRAAARAVRELIAQQCYDVVVVRYLRTARLAGLDRPVGVPRLLDFDDVDWLRHASAAEAAPWTGWRGRLSERLVRRRLERLCRKAAGTFDHVWVTSPRDRAAVAPLAATILPNIPFDVARPEMAAPVSAAPSDTILFVGLLSYPPNARGLARFLTAVWPTVQAACPAARLRVVGGGASEVDRERWSRVPGVELAGYVEHLTPEYAAAAFTIAPVYYGGGTKIKVVESLAYGRTIVVTPHALLGYEQRLRHRQELWVGQADAEFAEGCVRLLREPGERTAMAERGRNVVAAHYSSVAFERAVLDAVERLTGGPRGAGGESVGVNLCDPVVAR